MFLAPLQTNHMQLQLKFKFVIIQECTEDKLQTTASTTHRL